MLKKAGTVAIAAAGLMMLGSPAFAQPPGEVDMDSNFTWDYDDFGVYDAGESDAHDQMGAVNFGSDGDLLSSLSLLCNDDVNVLAIPILQGNDGTQLCGTSDDDAEDQLHFDVEEDDDDETDEDD